MPSDRQAWSWVDELEFIKKLGSHGPIPRNHRDAVFEYLETVKKRQDWGAIDRAKVVQACMRELSL
jgi:hypothetical protein